MPFHPLIQDGPGWETLKEESRFANAHVEVCQTTVRTPSRPDGASWTVVHRKAACVVVPMTVEGRFVLVRQERIPIRQVIWEFPAGQVDAAAGHGTALLEGTALRELQEESGYELAPGGELISLGHFFPSAGVTNEVSHLYLARQVVRGAGGPQHDENEAITECREFSKRELQTMIAVGDIRDANTLAAFARMCAAELI